ncbi:MAG: hypothetical protein K2X99_02390 [Gemmatimonadaceae bacterium]|nr:hypothetical protein [Gemmatimonadaceae bacterium]
MTSPLSRRALLGWASSALALVAGRRGAAQGAGARPVPAALARLQAVAEVTLPTALISGAAERFDRWMREYTPGAESLHGYGDATITRTPADPRPAWRTQLAELDRQALKEGSATFAALPRAARERIVRSTLDALPNARLVSDPLTAPHVIVALLSFALRAPEASDLAFEAQIGARRCRPLEASPDAPVPLTARRGR